MNLIIDELPQALELSGVTVPIRTDFRIGMLFELMIESRELSEREMTRQAFDLWFTQDALGKIAEQGLAAEALQGILWFYSCGKTEERAGGQRRDGIGKRIYDFEADAPLIYAAFRGQYGIDLQSARLHWWAFVALFSGLREEEEIVKIMSYRSVNLAEIKNKEERRRLSKLQAKFALPDRHTDEEKARIAGALFGGMK